jgi:DNA-binding MarR family transcriptional regulator
MHEEGDMGRWCMITILNLAVKSADSIGMGGGARPAVIPLWCFVESLKCKVCISRVGFRNGSRTSVGKSANHTTHKQMNLIDYVSEGGGVVCEPAPEYREKPVALGIHTLDTASCFFGTMDLVLCHLRASKMNLSSLHVLMILHPLENRRIKLNALAARMGLTCAGITKVADALDQMGFTFRSVVPGDRRSIFMNLTDEGAAFAESIEESLVSCIREGFGIGSGG